MDKTSRSKGYAKVEMKASSSEQAIELIRKMSDNGLRIGQIMSNVFDVAAKDSSDPFFITDDQLVSYLEKYKGN